MFYKERRPTENVHHGCPSIILKTMVELAAVATFLRCDETLKYKRGSRGGGLRFVRGGVCVEV